LFDIRPRAMLTTNSSLSGDNSLRRFAECMPSYSSSIESQSQSSSLESTGPSSSSLSCEYSNRADSSDSSSSPSSSLLFSRPCCCVSLSPPCSYHVFLFLILLPFPPLSAACCIAESSLLALVRGIESSGISRLFYSDTNVFALSDVVDTLLVDLIL